MTMKFWKLAAATLLMGALAACGGGTGGDDGGGGGGGGSLSVSPGDIFIVDTNDNDIYADDPAELAYIWDRDVLGSADLQLFAHAIGTKTSNGAYLVKWFLSADQVLDENAAGANGRKDLKLLQAACTPGGSSGGCDEGYIALDCDYESAAGTLKCDNFLLTDLKPYTNATFGIPGYYFLIVKVEDGLTSESKVFSFPVSLI